MHQEHKLGWYYVTTITALIIWSTSFIGTKIAYQTFPPITLGAARFVVASIVLGVIMLIKRERVRPNAKDLVGIGLSGVLGITLYFIMENTGLRMTTASNAALIVASYPAITTLLEWVVYRTPISRTKILGIVIAIGGVYLLSAASGEGQDANTSLTGNLILIATGAVWAAYIFATRRVVHKFPAVTLSFYQTIIGTACFLPFALLERTSWQMPTPTTMGSLMYLGMICSVAAFMLYNFGLRRLSPSTSASLMNLVPIFGTIFSILILGESLSGRQLVGGALVIVGVMISARPARAKQGG